jgi:lysyl-tRNA synthetase class II
MAMRCDVIQRYSIWRYSIWLAALFATTAFAHHSVSNFDFEKSVTVSGDVKYFSFTNPHSFIDIQVKNDKGAVTTWKVFATSKVVLQRYGWSPASVKAGDVITVSGHPDKTKPQEMYLTKIKFANGKEWLRKSIDN